MKENAQIYSGKEGKYVGAFLLDLSLSFQYLNFKVFNPEKDSFIIQSPFTESLIFF